LDDVQDTESSKKRYYLDTTLCYSCGQIGHAEKKCPRNLEAFCVLCTNNHYKSNCFMKICNKCNKLGHQMKFCREDSDKGRFIQCRRCANEHSVSDCPSWRHYVFKNNSYIEPIRVKACSNCGSNDHFVDDCRTKRSKFSIFTSQYKKVSGFFK
jgi:protein AIR1/2